MTRGQHDFGCSQKTYPDAGPSRGVYVWHSVKQTTAGLAALAVGVYCLLASAVSTTSGFKVLGHNPSHVWKAASCTITIDTVPVATLIVVAALTAWYFKSSRSRVYLLDFACYKNPPSMRVNLDQFLWGSVKFSADAGDALPEESLSFQTRISLRNGLSEYTSLPPGLHKDPPQMQLQSAIAEAKMVLFSAAREAFARAKVRPREVDFIIVNCSLFNPTPSLSAMVINHFKMRSDIISYNLAGMGCSAGIVSIDLARRLLKLTPNTTALVLSTENVTQNRYTGLDRSMLIPNTLFRMGSAAILLTSKASERYRAKYELSHVIRVHLGADDTAFKCVVQREDSQGKMGVTLTRDIVHVAARALQMNLTSLAPLVLPWSELIKYGVDFVQRKLKLRTGSPYQPDFGKAFQHFCLHAGGRAVIEGLGGQLGLTKANLEPSFSSLYWYGNTSSASYWYGFGYAESKQGMKKGDKIWQVGFGSGFKTNSAVWTALRTFTDTRHQAWEHVTPEDTAQMWKELEGMGCYFVNGVMPPYEEKKKKKYMGGTPGGKDNDRARKLDENGTHPAGKNENGGPLDNGPVTRSGNVGVTV